MRRFALFATAAIAAGVASSGCEPNFTSQPEGPVASLAGEWDVTHVYPDSVLGACRVGAAVTLGQEGHSLSGEAYVVYSTCESPPSGGVASGDVSARGVSLSFGSCTHSGAPAGAGADSLEGEVTCGGMRGTWTAARLGAAERLEILPGDTAVVVGGQVSYRWRLLDHAGHRLWMRSAAFASSAPLVASVSDNGIASALALGSTIIGADWGEVHGQAYLTVRCTPSAGASSGGPASGTPCP